MEDGMKKYNFGKDIREKEFCLREGSTFLNHGSYGVVPRRIKDLQKKYLDEMDRHPDEWYRRKAYKLWTEARDAAAEFVKADSEDIVLVQNATTGVNTILKSYPFKENDAILVTDNTYQAVQNTADLTSSRIAGGKMYSMTIPFPLESEDTIVDMYKDFLSKHPDVKIATIDYITSPTALMLPIEKIIKVCHEFNVLALIDGAHSVGQVDLNMKELGADFFTGNFHKWCFSPRSCALLYVKKEHQSWVRPVVTSFNLRENMTAEFYKQGTRDDIPFFCVPDAIKFYKEIGGRNAIVGYASNLLDEATSLLTSSWGTYTLPVPKSMEAPCMRMVKLPDLPGYTETPSEAERLMKDVKDKFDVQTFVISVHGPLYARISSQVYVETGDFQKFVNVVRQLQKEVK